MIPRGLKHGRQPSGLFPWAPDAGTFRKGAMGKTTRPYLFLNLRHRSHWDPSSEELLKGF